jgi:predicted DNA-binding transcriptional regulator YafY
LADSFNLFKGPEGDHCEVVVDFDAWGADDARSRKWHGSQELQELGQGRLRVTLRLNNLVEVEKWVLGFGKHATVVRPKELMVRMRDAGEEIMNKYGGRIPIACSQQM